jgi:hypothetical protein
VKPSGSRGQFLYDLSDPVYSLMQGARMMGRSITEEHAKDMIEAAGAINARRSADGLAKWLGLTFKVRQFLGIRTIGSIDVNKADRIRRRNAIKRERKALLSSCTLG